MFPFAQQSPAARRLIGLTVAATVAAGTAGSLAAADDADAMSCQLRGTQTNRACTDYAPNDAYDVFHP